MNCIPATLEDSMPLFLVIGSVETQSDVRDVGFFCVKVKAANLHHRKFQKSTLKIKNQGVFSLKRHLLLNDFVPVSLHGHSPGFSKQPGTGLLQLPLPHRRDCFGNFGRVTYPMEGTNQ